MKTYGTLKLTEASPAQSFTEPIDLSEIRHYLKLETPSPSDAEEDDLLWTYITTAREIAEIKQGRDLVEKQYDRRLDLFFPCEIELRQPLISVDLVQYTDSDGNSTSLVENIDYLVDLSRGIILPPYGGAWPDFTPWPSSAVLIRHTSGIASDDIFWSDSGKRIKSGMKLLIALWYENRMPFTESGQMAQELPYGVTALLSLGSRNHLG